LLREREETENMIMHLEQQNQELQEVKDELKKRKFALIETNKKLSRTQLLIKKRRNYLVLGGFVGAIIGTFGYVSFSMNNDDDTFNIQYAMITITCGTLIGCFIGENIIKYESLIINNLAGNGEGDP
jgi:hypothetical protein